MQRIPNRLKRCRKERGLSQTEVARILGVKNSVMISRWEKGLALPSPMNIFKLAAIYRTMTDALYTDLLASLRGEMQKREDALAQKHHHA
jgi:transcriptional regulator with XRE-family HTH domain